MFSPIRVGSLTLKNRLIKSAATSMVSDDEQKAVAYHGRIAAGGMGAVLIEGSYDMLARLDKRTVSAAGQGSGRLTIEESPLQAICAEVHSHDCPCLIQMKTATPGIVYQWENMGPEGETHKASLLSDADIQMYIEDTIDGAARLQAIGFAGIDLNAAGDNLPARFLSRFGNDRDASDPYGPGSIENRVRIATDIIKGVKERCGKDFVVQVLGFNAQAVDTAHYLTAQGKKVTLVSEQPEMAYGTGQSMMLNVYVKPAFLAMGGKIRPESTLKSVGDGEVTLTTGFGIDVTVPCDCVIDASDMLPDTALADELGSEFDVYTVGDCETPLNIANAISTANLATRHC